MKRDQKVNGMGSNPEHSADIRQSVYSTQGSDHHNHLKNPLSRRKTSMTGPFGINKPGHMAGLLYLYQHPHHKPVVCVYNEDRASHPTKRGTKKRHERRNIENTEKTHIQATSAEPSQKDNATKLCQAPGSSLANCKVLTPLLVLNC
jgi:hypothetical protein